MFTIRISFYILLVLLILSRIPGIYAFAFDLITPLFSFSVFTLNIFFIFYLLAWASGDRWSHGGIIQVKMTWTDRPAEDTLGQSHMLKYTRTHTETHTRRVKYTLTLYSLLYTFTCLLSITCKE